MVSAIRIEMNVPLKMCEGVTLRADVYRPDDKGSIPGIQPSFIKPIMLLTSICR